MKASGSPPCDDALTDASKRWPETLSDIFFRQPAFKLCNKVTEIDSEGTADHPQLDDINAPPTALHFANPHLLKGKAFGQLILAESKSLPNFREKLDENRVFFCMYAMSGRHKTYQHKKAPVIVIDIAVIVTKILFRSRLVIPRGSYGTLASAWTCRPFPLPRACDALSPSSRRPRPSPWPRRRPPFRVCRCKYARISRR